MTKLISTIFILFITTFCFSQTITPGFYFLAEKATDGWLVNDLDAEDVFAIEKNPILAKEDIERTKIVTLDFEPKNLKAIRLKLNNKAQKKWRAVKKRISKTGESIVFVCNDKVYHQQFMSRNAKTPNSYIDLIVEEKYIVEILGGLK